MVNTKEKQTKVISPFESSYRIKSMVILALICAMAYVVVVLCRIPIIPAAPFLDLEFKSAIILIGSFIFGPMSGLIMSVVICLVEMVTVSDSGIIGCIMNILATVSFVCPAAFVYKKKKTTLSAIIGIALGTVLLTIVMVLWNYILTPIYQGLPREAVAAMLLPVFVPFNLIKGALNGGVALFIFKLAIEALRKANLIPQGESDSKSKAGSIIGAVVSATIVILTCVLVICAINGVF